MSSAASLTDERPQDGGARFVLPLGAPRRNVFSPQCASRLEQSIPRSGFPRRSGSSMAARWHWDRRPVATRMRVAQPLSRQTAVGATTFRLRGSELALRSLGYIALALSVILVGIPMYWMLLAAFKTNQEIFTAPPTWIPLAPTLAN